MGQSNSNLSRADADGVILPEAELCERARRLSAELKATDTLLLRGPLGAGKTTFARAVIQGILGSDEDVPSPSFTLVQVYETPQAPLWHVDLYRLSDPSELTELGLDEAFDIAICIVEWPERLGDHTPPDALHLSLAAVAEHADLRHLSATSRSTRWKPVITQMLAHA